MDHARYFVYVSFDCEILTFVRDDNQLKGISLTSGR